MEPLIIFGAQKLIFLSPLLVVWVWYRSSIENREKLIRFGLLSLPLTYLIALLARALWFHPRPFVISGLEPLIPHLADNGFPSDHMLLASALAVLISYFDRKWGAVLWFIALLLGISRVLAQIHHSSDILGSALIAIVVGALVHFVFKDKKQV